MDAHFIPATQLPSNTTVSDVLIFPFIGNKMILHSYKTQWHPVGGHLGPNEDYREAIIRLGFEQTGIYILESSIRLLGYIVSDEAVESSVTAVLTSFVAGVETDWEHSELEDRELFKLHEALEKVIIHPQVSCISEVTSFVIHDYEEQNYTAEFIYHPNVILDNVPVTQVFNFCRNENGDFCIVQDFDEDFYSLPGGGCELGENPEACLQREMMEEAQITCKNVQLLGTIEVRLLKNDVVISQFQHLRYLSDVDSISEFIANKDGFETVSREFVSYSELPSKANTLQNPTAEKILSQLDLILNEEKA